MSTSISTTPVSPVITNKPQYVVDTTLTESSSYNNLRIRGTLYVDGDVAAIIEQPKGLINFDFSKILESLAGKFSNDFKSATKVFTPISSGTNIYTGAWVNAQGWASFTSANETAVSGNSHASTYNWARSAAITGITKGDIIVVCLTTASTITAGTDDTPTVRLSKSTVIGTDVVEEYSLKPMRTNGDKMFYFMARETITNAYLWIGLTANASYSISLGVRTLKISIANQQLYNRPAVYFKVLFQTYYEDSTGVTQASVGETAQAATQLYVPMKGILDADLTGTYILAGNTDRFCSKSVGLASITKHFIYNKSYCRIRVLGLSTFAYTPDIRHSLDGAGYSTESFYHGGWFVVNIESESFVSAVVSKFNFLYRSETNTYSNTHEVEFSSKCWQFPVMLDFKGKLGNEFLVFTGIVKKGLKANKDDVLNKYGVKIPIKAQPIISMSVGTDMKSEEYFNLVAELISSTKTPELIVETNTNYIYDYCVPAGIETENVTTNEYNNVVTNELNLHYYDYSE